MDSNTRQQHTPGPWKAEWNAVKGFTIYGLQGEPVAASLMYAGREQSKRANAHLIAAAPDLLALMDATATDLEVLAESDTLDAQELATVLAKNLRAAIAKATGAR